MLNCSFDYLNAILRDYKCLYCFAILRNVFRCINNDKKISKKIKIVVLQACTDRCVKKFMESQELVQKRMQAMDEVKQQQMQLQMQAEQKIKNWTSWGGGVNTNSQQQ